MNEDSWRLSFENSSKMESIHSSQSQCCCCVVAVLVSLGGVIMTSIGVCLLLNYGMINIDILPPELQTGEGKKIIGIILICFGITGIIISSLVSILFFTICHAPQSSRTVSPKYYDRRMRKNSSPYIVDRSVNGGSAAKAGQHPNRVPCRETPSTSTPRKGYNTKKKKTNHSILESVKEDTVHPCRDPVPILRINSINLNDSIFPMKNVNLDSFNSTNATPTLEKNTLQNGITPRLDITTIQITPMEQKDSEIHSTKL